MNPSAPEFLTLLGRILDERGIGLCLFDTDDRVRYWNAGYLTLFPEEADLLAIGLPYADTLRRFYEVNLPSEELARMDAYLAEGLRRHREQRVPYVYQRRDGRWIRTESYPLTDGGLLKLWTDITDQGHGHEDWPELRDSFLSSELAIALFDAEGGFVSANQAYHRLLGTATEGLPERGYQDHLQRIAGQTLSLEPDPRRSSLIQRGWPPDPLHSALVLARRDGGWLQLEERLTRSHGLICFWSDISTRQAAQQQARLLQQRLSDAIESLAEGVALFDADERLLLCNQRYRQINALVADLIEPGVSWEQLTRTAIERGLFPQALGQEPGWLEERRQRRRRDHPPFDVALADGHWVRYTDRRTRDGGVISVRFDITDLKQREVELHNSEQRFRTIAENLPVVINNPAGEVLYASPPTVQLLGLSFEQLRQRPVRELIVEARDREQLLERLRGGGEVIDYELALRRGDGRTFPAALTTRRIVYDGQRALLSTVTDLSERKAAEAEIARQREALHQAEKLSALGSLLAGVAHELNNPLAIVVGQAQQLEREARQPNSVQRAGRIRAAAERCARIVKTFLAMARQRPAERCAVDLNALIAGALELTEYGLRANDIQIERAPDPRLSPLQADPDQLSQLLLNLIVNAQQALVTRPPPRRLVLSTRHASDPERIELTVTDNGPGIPEAIRSRVFEPFFTTKPVGMGTGVGLSLCHGVAVSHGGDIQALDAPGGGTRILVRLPIGPIETTRAPVADAESRDDATGRRILIVDDEPEIAELLAEILDHAGYRTTLAASGHQALEQLAAQPFDAILSDLRMPDLDGPGLYRVLVDHYPELARRLLFITGDSLGLPALPIPKAIQVIEKPFAPGEIRQAVAGLLARR